MNLRKLISTSLLYTIADMAVLVVAGFLLLPLYTRTLSQPEFGMYVVVRANTELLSYLLYLGVPSAMARLYFDYLKVNRHQDYVGTLALAFLACVLAASAATYCFGDVLWSIVAPAIPARPYLWFCVGTAALSFYSLLGLTWLRLDEAIRSVVSVQLVVAALLALLAWLALDIFKGGLSALLVVLLLSNLPGALVLLGKLYRGFERPLPMTAISSTLVLGAPIFFSYLSNFVLQRTNLFIMQHWVGLGAIAVFGLATQLSSLITVASMSFSKAVQPVIFKAGADEIEGVLLRIEPLHVCVMAALAVSFGLFADDLIAIVAPHNYAGAYDIVLLLAFAALVNSLSLLSDTVLMYSKKPTLSLIAAVCGAAVSVLAGILLTPTAGAIGAAFSLILAFGVRTFTSQAFSSRYVRGRLTRYSLLASVATAAAFVCFRLLHTLDLPLWTSVSYKLLFVAFLGLACGYYVVRVRGISIFAGWR